MEMFIFAMEEVLFWETRHAGVLSMQQFIGQHFLSELNVDIKALTLFLNTVL